MNGLRVFRCGIFAVAASAVFLAGCSAGGSAQSLPSFVLTNQSGRIIRAEELRGRAVVISFIFTTCHEVCPLVTGQLAQAQAEARAAGLTSSVRFISITLDRAPTRHPCFSSTRHASGWTQVPGISSRDLRLTSGG